MSSNKARKNKGKVALSNHKQTRYSSNWIRRGLDLAKSLEQPKAAGKAEKIQTEDVYYQKFRFNQDGEGSVAENILYQIVCQIFPAQLVIRHHRPAWLLGLELDIYLPTLNLAFEYQGQQHFHPIKAWGGEKALKKIKERDARKVEICRQIGVKLIHISYTELLTEDYVCKVLIEQSIIDKKCIML